MVKTREFSCDNPAGLYRGVACTRQALPRVASSMSACLARHVHSAGGSGDRANDVYEQQESSTNGWLTSNVFGLCRGTAAPLLCGTTSQHKATNGCAMYGMVSSLMEVVVYALK